MTIDSPKIDQLPQLRALWKEAFGDTDAYLDSFFTLGFSPERCRCVTEDGQVSAALYWFDCPYTSGGGWEYASDRFKVSARIVGFSIRAGAVEDTCLLPGFRLVDYERTIGKSSVAVDRNRVASH